MSARLARLYSANWDPPVKQLLLAPRLVGTRTSLEDVVAQFPDLVPSGLLPLAIVDDASLAVVALRDLPGIASEGHVLRLFTSEVADEFQFALLDVDPMLYVVSLAEELKARPLGLNRVLDEIGPAYLDSHISREKRPRDYVVRPIRIACQNVILGMAAIAQDSSFDGLTVPAWQTCEVPHVATHEGNRALAALMLCDAFQNGGTLEVRFDRKTQLRVGGRTKTYSGHPEGKVPASLRRYGRTVGVLLGAEIPGAITPKEARALFQAITPMPATLRARAAKVASTYGLTPERVCFALLSGVWSAIELDFLLATSSRADSILDGGATWTDRVARQAESEACRAAVMTGMLHKRVDALDAARPGEEGAARVVEDRKRGVTWIVDENAAVVTLLGLDPMTPIPWSRAQPGVKTLHVVPRSAVSPATIELLQTMVSEAEAPVALLIPCDAPEPECPPEVVVLRCPDRLADIDKAIEGHLLTMRISRA
jgi:hypothetical protein